MATWVAETCRRRMVCIIYVLTLTCICWVWYRVYSSLIITLTFLDLLDEMQWNKVYIPSTITKTIPCSHSTELVSWDLKVELCFLIQKMGMHISFTHICCKNPRLLMPKNSSQHKVCVVVLKASNTTVPVPLHTLHTYILFANTVHVLNTCDISTVCTSLLSDHCSSRK